MKWLGINQQKSLFKSTKFQDNLSQSFISQDSEYTISEPSPLIPNEAQQAQIKQNLVQTFKWILDKESKKSLSRSPSSKLSTFMPENRRASCLNSLNFKLEIPQNKQLDKSVDETPDSNFSPKNLKNELEEINECKEDDQYFNEAPQTQRKPKNIIKPSFIIRKKNIPSVKISKVSETPKKELKSPACEEKQPQTERKLKIKKNRKILQSAKKSLRPSSRTSQRSGRKSGENFKDRKSSLPNLNKWDTSKVAQSYFKSSLNSLANIENTSNTQTNGQRKEKCNYMTSKHASSKSKLMGGTFLFANEFSRNDEKSYLNLNNHWFFKAKRGKMNRKSFNTISMKDFLTNDTLETGRRLLPELNNKESRKMPKFNDYKSFSIKTTFSPSKLSNKAFVGSDQNFLKTERNHRYSKNVLNQGLNSNLRASLGNKNSYSTSNLRNFVGSSTLKPGLSKAELKEISEHQSLSSSREVSLEQIDESNKEIPKQYINLRKSFKEMNNSTSKSSKKQSTFKIRKSKSRSKKSPSLC